MCTWFFLLFDYHAEKSCIWFITTISGLPVSDLYYHTHPIPQNIDAYFLLQVFSAKLRAKPFEGGMGVDNSYPYYPSIHPFFIIIIIKIISDTCNLNGYCIALHYFQISRLIFLHNHTLHSFNPPHNDWCVFGKRAWKGLFHKNHTDIAS